VRQGFPGVWVFAGATVSCTQQPEKIAVIAAFPHPDTLLLYREMWDRPPVGLINRRPGAVGTGLYLGA
jgi:hypothetical protein